MNWPQYFIRMAGLVSTKSKDPSTKVGVVVVGPDNEILTTGFNGFPRGVDEHERVACPDCGGNGTDPCNHYSTTNMRCQRCDGSGGIESEELHAERWERPAKYLYVECAERNAIYNAARVGVSLNGATMYFNFGPSCTCNQCAKAVIQAGIKRLVGPDVKFPGKGTHWEESLNASREMLCEAGVEMVTI